MEWCSEGKAGAVGESRIYISNTGRSGRAFRGPAQHPSMSTFIYITLIQLKHSKLK